ncbi:MAG: pseudouridine synthase [Solirubrobacterales bacterium]
MERLQKYMAGCGIASRRKCEEIITAGRVKVNDTVVVELGYKVGIEDRVYVDGKLITPEERKVYIALNKPTGYVSTVKDERGRKTIIDLIDIEERIYPVGRLDYDTSGLILLTNDGDIYNRIIHPREEKEKVYIAVVKGTPSRKELDHFRHGVDIGGYVTAPSKIKVIRALKDITEVEISIHEGKNRQIRKMCSEIGHEVITLKRVKIGKIKLGGLKEGTWRFLTDEEVEYFKGL